MNSNFHTLIGGIEAVVHFIENFNYDRTSGRIIPATPGTDDLAVVTALNDLRAVKLALLDAECDFMIKIANMEHIPAAYNSIHAADVPPAVPPPVLPGTRLVSGETAPVPDRVSLMSAAREEWNLSREAHGAQWIAILSEQTAKFANAIYSLQLQAPEWSMLDGRIIQLMDQFKRSAESDGGGGGDDNNPSWGSNFPPQSSSSSSQP
jgi:hypothetical protein